MPRRPILRRPSMSRRACRQLPACTQCGGHRARCGRRRPAVAAIGFAAGSPVGRPAWRASCPMRGGILPPRTNRQKTNAQPATMLVSHFHLSLCNVSPVDAFAFTVSAVAKTLRNRFTCRTCNRDVRLRKLVKPSVQSHQNASEKPRHSDRRR